MTLIASNNVLMSARHARWLSLKEVLGVQGFPVSADYTLSVPCSSYAKRVSDTLRGQACSAWPSRRSACQQAGNSMHVAVSGIVALYCLTQITVDPGNLRAQQYNLRRQLACGSKLGMISPKGKAKPDKTSSETAEQESAATPHAP